MSESLVFRRGFFDTLTGLLHIIAGFSSSLWSLISLLLIGYDEVFQLGIFWGVYNYISESTSLLLWLSGIGILRNKKWGKALAVAWSFAVIVKAVFSRYYSEYRWGAHIPEYDWDIVLKLYYSLFFLCATGCLSLLKDPHKKETLKAFILRFTPGKVLSGIFPAGGKRK